MPNLSDLTTEQIERIIAIKKKIEKLHVAVKKRVGKLQGKIDSIADGGGGMPSPFTAKKRRHRMSRAGRAAIAAAAKARWAKYRGTGATKSKKPAKKRRKVSAAVKAKLAAIARARWAKAKAAGKRAL